MVQKYFAEQETSLKETLQKATLERQTTVEKLQQRKGEIHRLLAVERKKKEEARLKAEEERRRQEELERKRIAEEELRRKQEEEQERKQRIQAAVELIRSYHNEGDLENALAEIEKAREIEAENDDLIVWENRIKEAQSKKKRDEEARLSRKKEIAQQQRKKKTKTALFLKIAAVLVVVGIIVYQLQKSVFPGTVSLAIEPFATTGLKANEVGLGSSIAHAVAQKMSIIPDLNIMGFSSSAAIARTERNPARAYNGLGYPYHLQGTLTNKGGVYVAELRIVDSTNSEVWTGHIEQPATDLPLLPKEIALQLAKAMDLTITEQTELQLKRSGTSNSLAYQSYLSGIELLDGQTPAELQEAYTRFMEATRSDARFADAYAEAASVLLSKLENRWEQGQTVFQNVEQLLNQALKQQPNLPSAKIGRARLAILRRQFPVAAGLLDSELKENNKNAKALRYKGYLLLCTGDIEDANAILNHAYSINPRDIGVLTLQAYVNTLRGKHREAMKYLDYAVPLVEDSSRFLTTKALAIVMADPDLQLNSARRITNACEQLLQTNPRDIGTLYRYAQILQVQGKIPEANVPLNTIRAILQNQLIYSPHNGMALMDLALAVTRFGSFPAGLDLGRRAIPLASQNPEILYRVSQLYSIQMATNRGSKIDSTKKREALLYLGKAIATEYRPEELIDGDFYNLRTQPEFLTTLKLQTR